MHTLMAQEESKAAQESLAEGQRLNGIAKHPVQPKSYPDIVVSKSLVSLRGASGPVRFLRQRRERELRPPPALAAVLLKTHYHCLCPPMETLSSGSTQRAAFFLLKIKAESFEVTNGFWREDFKNVRT